MTTKLPAALIRNATAGNGSAAADELRAQLSESLNLSVYDASPDDPPPRCAERALAAGARLVIAAGGDGTVSGVSSVMVGRPESMAIIPCGTANSVAAALGIPSDPLEAALAAVQGGVRAIDTATANGRTMVLIASMGFHAAAVGETDASSKARWGMLAYLATGFMKLLDLQPFRATLTTEDERITCDVNAVTIANLASDWTLLAQGPSMLCPQDGLLDATLVSARSIAEAVATGVHLLRTTRQHSSADRDNVGFISARRFRVETDPPQPLLIDGDDVGTTPVDVQCLPGSLNVILPAALLPGRPTEEKLEGLPGLRVRPR